MGKFKGVKKIDFSGLEVTDKGNGKITVSLGAAGATTLPSDRGGTGTTSFTDKAVCITQDSGTEAISTVAMDAHGELLIGGTSGPAVGTINQGTSPQNGIAVTNADGAIDIDLDLKSNGGAVIESNELAVDLGASSITGTLAVGDGGTGQTTYTNGQLLIGNTTGNTLTKATISGTTNEVDVTNGTGTIQIGLPSDVTITGDLTVSGNKITMGNNAVVDNETDAAVLAFTTEDGYRFSGGDADSEVLNLELWSDGHSPTDIDKWRIQINQGLWVLQYDGNSGNYANILTHSATGTAGATDTSLAGSLVLYSDESNRPVLEIRQTADNDNSGELQFYNEHGGEDAGDNADLGRITFYGRNDDVGGTSETKEQYAEILVESEETGDGTEGGKVTVKVASHDAGMETGLIIEDGDADAELDVTIASGANSVTNIKGNTVIDRYIKAPAAFQLTGTVDANATTTVTGTGTAFLSELKVGDMVTIDDGVHTAETREVMLVYNDTRYTVHLAYTDLDSGATATVTAPSTLVVTEPGSDGQFIIGNTGVPTILGYEGTEADLIFRADQGDDAGDSWRIRAETNGRLLVGNDMATKGTFANVFQFTGHATPTSTLTTFYGELNSNGPSIKMQGDNPHIIIKEGDAPSGEATFGKIYVKDDVPCTLHFLNDSGTDFELTNTPGTLIGFTHQQAIFSYTLTTSNALVDGSLGLITFTTPPSNKVLLEVQLQIVQGSTIRDIIMSLTNTGFSADAFGDTFKYEISKAGRASILTENASWVLPDANLNPIGAGNSIYLTAYTDSTLNGPSLKWGGGTDPEKPVDLIMKATILPA